jgi:hypothetical protein
LAALLAWPVLGHMPTTAETTGCVVVMAGLILAVTGMRSGVATRACSHSICECEVASVVCLRSDAPWWCHGKELQQRQATLGGLS